MQCAILYLHLALWDEFVMPSLSKCMSSNNSIPNQKIVNSGHTITVCSQSPFTNLEERVGHAVDNVAHVATDDNNAVPPEFNCARNSSSWLNRCLHCVPLTHIVSRC